MKLTMLAVTSLLLLPSVVQADAAPEKGAKSAPKKKAPPPTLLERIQKLLPRGWRLETKGLPAGVEGVALGPMGKGGRAVVMLSLLESGTGDEELDGQARAFLAEQVEASPSVDSVRAVADGVPGAAEFAAVAPMSGSGTEERLVRYLVASGKPSYLLTVVAPKSTFDATYRQVVDIATRLRRSTSRQ